MILTSYQSFFSVWMDIEFDSLTWIDLTQTHGHRGEAGGEVGGQQTGNGGDAGHCCCYIDVVVVVVLCSGAGSGLRLRRENIGRYNGRVAASAVQASVHQLNNPGFLTFLRRLLEIRDKCLVKSNSIYNPQNSANPLLQQLPAHSLHGDTTVSYDLKPSLGTFVKVLCGTCQKFLNLVKSL